MDYEYLDEEQEIEWYFPHFQKENARLLMKVLNFFDLVSTSIPIPHFVISVIGIIVIPFHLFVLLQKSMRNSCTNILMISIAICDISALLANIKNYSSLRKIFDQENVCQLPITYNALSLSHIFSSFAISFNRISSWLAMLLAAIRSVSVKFAATRRFDSLTEAQFALYPIVISILFGTPVGVFSYIHGQIFEYGEWQQPEICHSFPENYTQVEYAIMQSDFYNKYNLLFIDTLTDGTTRLIPTVCYLPLTIILIFEIRKHRKKSSQSEIAHKSANRTTLLVIYVTITYVIVEFPISIVHLYQTFVNQDNGIAYLSSYVVKSLGIVISTNSIIHCLICFLMSSQYQNSCRMIFRIKKSISDNRISNMSSAVSMNQLNIARNSNMSRLE